MKLKNNFYGIMAKIDINTNIVDINNLSSLLIKSGYKEKFSFSNEQLSILNFSNVYSKVLYENLEFDEASTFQKISNNYGRVIASINEKFNVKSPFKEIFKQYVYYTKANISINIFLNWLIILDFIITNFENIFDDSLYNLSDNKIKIFNLDSISNFDDDNENIDKLDNIYANIKNQPQFLNKEVESNLIIILYLFSLENKIIYNIDITDPTNILNLLELYNKIYFSDITIALLTYIEIIILLNINLYYNKTKKIPLDKKVQININEININKKKNSVISNEININKSNIPNFHLFDEELKAYKDTLNISLQKIILFQNCLKLYILNHIGKNKIKSSINLSIHNIHEFIKKINDNKNKKKEKKGKLNFINQGAFAPNNNFEENLKNYIKSNKVKSSRNTFNKHDNDIISKKNISDRKSNFYYINDEEQNQYSQYSNINYIKIMTKNNLDFCLNYFSIEELLIKIINTMNFEDVKKINTNYMPIISSSNFCYFQASILSLNSNYIKEDIKDNEILDYSIDLTPRTIQQDFINNISEKILDNLSLKEFYNENEILNYLLDYYSHLDIKKLPKNIIINLSTFKCIINNQIKNIQILFNFSKIKEKVLFEYLKEVKNMFLFTEKYKNIIKALKDFKTYSSTIRVSQTNFRSNQLNYIFTLIIHVLVDYVEDNSFNKIIIYETQLKNYNHNMKVYLKDYSLKKKNLNFILKLIAFKCSFFNKINFIIEYLNDFVEIWDLIVFSDTDKDFKLLKTFEDNKLFIFLMKEKFYNNKNLISSVNKNNNIINNDNTKKNKKIKNSSLLIKDDDNKIKDYEYLNIIMNIKNSLSDFIEALESMESFLSNKNLSLDFKTNLICDRIFFEEKIYKNKTVNQLQLVILNMIDDFFFITKANNNQYNINKTNVLNNENKVIKSVNNEYYNYDFFIGDDFIGVSNNHIYDFKLDEKNNFYQLIYDFLSVLSSCIELIYSILKIKSIFILRFVYIIRTKNNLYYSLEIKNWNFFIKKISDFSSLFTVNIKNSKPLICFLKKKIESNEGKIIEESIEDNFFDIFLRLFLNLHKVLNKSELNQEFLKKIHKNIFKECSYYLVSFSYEGFLLINEFFISNDYLLITNNEKFEEGYIIPYEGFFDKKNYKKIINLIEAEENNLIVKNIKIFNFGIDYNYLYKNKENVLFGFSKANYFIMECNNHMNKMLTEYEKNKAIIRKKLEEKRINKKYYNKILTNIEHLCFGNYFSNDNNNYNNKIAVYNIPIHCLNLIIEAYIKEKMLIKTQKDELYNFKNEEKNISEDKDKVEDTNKNNNKKDCIIY